VHYLSSAPRVVLLTGREARHRVWHASQYEFEDVIAAVDDVRMLAPSSAPERSRTARARLARMAGTARDKAARLVDLPPRVPVLDEPAPADLFFGVFAAPHELLALEAVRHHVDACRTKVAFVVEMWEPGLPTYRHALRHLRGFDHVFVFNRAVLPAVRDLTGAACSYLPTATDALRFAPASIDDPRPIDVSSHGQRLSGTHAALVASAEARHLYYAFDTVEGPFDVVDHREHRLALAQQLQHSRYGVVYRNNESPARLRRTGGEEALTNRQFEVLAAGAVMLGTRPAVADFDSAFDWPDSIVEIPAPAPQIEDIVAQLDLQPERMRAARGAGVHASLTRHDWSHRWRTVLDAVGMAPGVEADDRDRALQERAAQLRAAQLRAPVR
jgi:hypothetical protein